MPWEKGEKVSRLGEECSFKVSEAQLSYGFYSEIVYRAHLTQTNGLRVFARAHNF